jgi:hypothetical protein
MIRVKRLKLGTERAYRIETDRELTDEQIMALALTLSKDQDEPRTHLTVKILVFVCITFVFLSPILWAERCEPPPGQEEKP